MANGEVSPPQLPSGPSGSFIADHKLPLIAGGISLLVIIFLLYRHYHSAGQTTSAGASCVDSNGNPGVTDANGNCISQVQTPGFVDTGGLVTQNELYQDTSGLATKQEEEQVSKQLTGIANGINGKGGSQSPQKIGNGYLTTQSGYLHINPSQNAWAIKNKQIRYYEPTLGVFKALSPTQHPGGTDTPIYLTPKEEAMKGFPK